MAEMLSLLFHTGPPGSAERGGADCNDGASGEQGAGAPAREPRAVRPGPQPHRGCRGHPGLTLSWSFREEKAMGLWLGYRKNNAPHPRISEG